MIAARGRGGCIHSGTRGYARVVSIAESLTRSVSILAPGQWQALEAQHQERADALTAGRRARSGTGATHPVDDFLFTYYPFRPGLLRRWHPGAYVALQEAVGLDRASWKWYQEDSANGRPADVSVNAAAFGEANQRSIRFIVSLLSSTAGRTANFGCFGLHEWAMVYQQDEHRHEAPLRLSQGDTDEVVQSHKIACTHFDAFRFFTKPAEPLNRLQPTRDNQLQLEQPGCLHAGMDVYKWVIKLGPLIPGELLLDCFELARDIRQVDMRASPYDLGDWGYTPIAIETPDGKAEYVREQRSFTERGNVLRARAVDAVRAGVGSLLD
ncbi:MAG: 3-methyladenine glycosylase [Glaciihabitans sp.]|nr:3-methyladenine glycosylase [Glaciihabitans sp.]